MTENGFVNCRQQRMDPTHFVIFNAEYARAIGVVPKRDPEEINALFLEILAELCK
jgi:hypothetical protein